jgi:NAD(P)-dependent dehydrogenase (short-subunit alcohol dehydrogenase family)
LEAAVTSLQAEFPSSKIIGQALDVTDDAAVNSATTAASNALGDINILLCFAGVVGCTHALEMSAQEWRRTLDINITGSFLCAQAIAKQMVANGAGGSIVLTASISAHRVNFPQPQVAYNVSKAGVLAMKNSLAAEWARYGIRVNTVSPGYMDTILNEGAGLQTARDIWASRNPMGRMGVPEELTGAILLLVSGAGTYINGADIVCDGGTIVF